MPVTARAEAKSVWRLGAQGRSAQADQVFSREKMAAWRCGCPAQAHVCPDAGAGKRGQMRRSGAAPPGRQPASGASENRTGGNIPRGTPLSRKRAARRAADGSGISRAPRAKLPVPCRTAVVRPLTGGWGGAEAVRPLRRHGRTRRDRLFQADAGAVAPSRGASVSSSCCHHQRARRQSRSMSPPAATLSICRYWRTASWL